MDSLEKIKEEVFQLTGLRFKEYLGKGRKRVKVMSRIIFSKKCQLAGFSKSDTGRILRRDHATIIYYLKKYDDDFKYNVYFRMIIGKEKQSRNAVTYRLL